MELNLSYSVLTANVLSIMLILTIYFSNRRRMNDDKSMKAITRLMMITAFSNIADTVVYYIDGRSGIFFTVLMYINASWLFLANVSVGYMWVKFLTAHLNIPFSDTRKKIYQGLFCFACICLIINIFYPLVFTAYNNVYERGSAYWVFLVIAFFYIIDSVYLYLKCRQKVGTLKLFPVQVFLFPIIVGVIIQALFLEMAITWPSIAIALAGMVSALKNEVIFTDCLTGLYNRVYLEFLQQQIYKKKDAWLSGVMADLNGFKQINDNYGHSAGDAALIVASNLLNATFGAYGVVTRYAGDEFVILLNTTDKDLVCKLIDNANKAFEEVNHLHKKPYQLSVAMGYAVVDLNKQTIDEFINRIDGEMYKNKLMYYKEKCLTP